MEATRTTNKVEGDGSYRITIIARRKRLCDADNANIKMCLDSLRYNGLIPDDHPGIVREVIVQQEKTKGKPETVVRIERLD
jgi:hypothetical protein